MDRRSHVAFQTCTQWRANLKTANNEKKASKTLWRQDGQSNVKNTLWMSGICKNKSIFFGLENIFFLSSQKPTQWRHVPTWSWLSPATAELRFSVTSSQLNEIVHRLLASPFSVYNPQLVAAHTRKLPHPSPLVCFALLSHFGGSPSPPPPPLPHLTFSFSFYLLLFLLLGCAADLSVRCWTLTPERSASFTQTWVWNTLSSLLLLFITGQGLFPVHRRHVQGGQVGLGHLLHSL